MYRPKHAVLVFLYTSVYSSAFTGRTFDRQSVKDDCLWSGFYKVIVDYSLFRPLGRRPPDTKPKYQLIAVKIPAPGPAKAIIKESRSNQIYYFGVGDQLQLTKAEKIDANQVSLNLEEN